MEARSLFGRPVSAFQSTNPAFTEENCRRSEKLALMPSFSPFSSGEAANKVAGRITAELRDLHEEVALLAKERIGLIKRVGGEQQFVYIGPAVGQPSGAMERDLDACLTGLDCELKQLNRLASLPGVSETFAAAVKNLATAVAAVKTTRQNLARLLHMSRSVGMRPPSNEEKKQAELNLAESLRKLKDAAQKTTTSFKTIRSPSSINF